LSLNHWVSAARPRTLPLALACIALGSLLAADRGFFDGWLTLWMVLTAASYQLLSNLANDLGDFRSGADAHRTASEGVEARAVASGLIQETQMQRAVNVLTVLALGFTVLTSWWGTSQLGWPFTAAFLSLGALATMAARGYTMGWAYGYKGLGDLFVIVFFGPVGVAGSFFLQTQTWDTLMILPGLSVGFLAAAVLNLNNMRDIETDRAAGKRTLAMRMGLPMAKLYQTILVVEAYTATTVFIFLQAEVTCSRSFLYAATLPLLGEGVYKTWKAKTPAQLDALLKPTALQTVLFALLLGVGLLIDANQCGKPLF
jgi:1,4-dihydroxy-2-naphthoate octaprenyltransferase